MTARKKHQKETRPDSRSSGTRPRNALLEAKDAVAAEPLLPAATGSIPPDTGDIDHGWDPLLVPSTANRESRPRDPALTLLELDPLQYDVVAEPRSSQPTLPELDPLQYDRDE